MAILTEDQQTHLRDYFYIFAKRKLIIVVFFILAVIAGVVFTALEKVTYEASATVLIEKDNPNIVDFKEVMAFDASSTEYYRTQYEMIKTNNLIEELVEEENLDQDRHLLGMQKKGWRRFLRKQKFLVDRLGKFLTEPTLVYLFKKEMLKIRPVRNSRLVMVTIRHPDSQRAADIANTLVDLFIQRNLRNRYAASRQANEMIAEQLVELKEKVSIAEKKLQEYKEEKQLVSIPSIHENDKFLQEAKFELVKLQAEESKMAKRYLPAHPKRIHLRSQIEGLEEKIQEEENEQLSLGRVAIKYSEYEREAAGARKIYEALLERYQETHSEAEALASNIIVVDRAVPQRRPYKPRPFLNIMIALFLGVFGGVLLAYFVDYFDSTVKIPEDIEKGLGLQLLGIIPQEGRPKDNPLNGELFFREGKLSAAAESIRALRTSLLFNLRRVQGCRVILVTSPNPEEGKSTLSLNLAAAFQQNHLKVLLIDSDLRKPRLHKSFGLAGEKGISDILEGEAQFNEVVHENLHDVGFHFLTAGTKLHHPTEMISAGSMRVFVEQLKNDYDIIIFDSAPYLAVADTAVLSEYADEVVVVAKYHKTDRRHLRELKRTFKDMNESAIGIVINQVSVREKNYYYHRYYYYGYGEQTQS